jgi:hypothetical protein
MQITVTNFRNRARDLDISGAEKLDLPLATLAGAASDYHPTRQHRAIGIRHLACAAWALRRADLVLLGPIRLWPTC